MFEAPELRVILDAALMPIRAMVLLGLNSGFGNADCATLPLPVPAVRSGERKDDGGATFRRVMLPAQNPGQLARVCL
jgi:hypothetical protein